MPLNISRIVILTRTSLYLMLIITHTCIIIYMYDIFAIGILSHHVRSPAMLSPGNKAQSRSFFNTSSIPNRAHRKKVQYRFL